MTAGLRLGDSAPLTLPTDGTTFESTVSRIRELDRADQIDIVKSCFEMRDKKWAGELLEQIPLDVLEALAPWDLEIHYYVQELHASREALLRVQETIGEGLHATWGAPDAGRYFS